LAAFYGTGEFEHDDCLSSSAWLSVRAAWTAATRAEGPEQGGRRTVAEVGWDLLSEVEGSC